MKFKGRLRGLPYLEPLHCRIALSRSGLIGKEALPWDLR